MSTPCTTNVHYLLTAEFDNKFGPIVRNQYPSVIPGFEYDVRDAKGKDGFNLASLMIPNNAEYNTGAEPDTTVFMLFRNGETMTYELFPPEQTDQVMYFVNLVHAQEDESNNRGTKIKAVALGTDMIDFMAFKPFAFECLRMYMRMQADEDVTKLLKACLKLLNKAELSFVRRLHDNDIKQSLLLSLGNKERLQNWIDEENRGGNMFKKLLRCHHQDKYSNRLMLRKGKIRIILQGYRPKRDFIGFVKIPLEFDAVRWGAINWSMPYNTRISRFLLNFIPFLRKTAVKADTFHFKLIIHSSRCKGSELSQFTITISNLMGLTNTRRYFANKRCVILPFIDVSMIGPLREYLGSQDNGSFVIMGTTNPIFKFQDGLYDYYYDLDNELMCEAANDGGKDTPSKWDGTAFKKLFAMHSISSSSSTECPRIGFLQKMIECIDEQETDMFRIISSFQKINVMQLLQLNYPVQNVNPEHLFDEYITKYRDMVVFHDIFETETLRILHLLKTMNDTVSKLYQPSLPLLDRTDLLCQLDDTLSEIYYMITTDENHLDKFLATCLKYPFLFPCSRYNLQEDNLAKTNLKQELRICFKEDESWLSLVEDPEEQEPIIPRFTRDYSSSLICMPLLFNADVRVKRPPTSEPPEVLIRQPASASIRRRKSVNIKQMLGIGKSKENFADASSMRPNSDAFTQPNTSGSKLLRSESSSTLSSKLNNIDLDRKTKNVRLLAHRIVSAIQAHFIGELIMDHSLAPIFRTILGTYGFEQHFKEETPSDVEYSDTTSTITTNRS